MEDGEFEGKIEYIAESEDGDYLYISNGKPNLWFLSFISKYKKIGKFKVKKPHSFYEDADVIVIKKNGKIIKVQGPIWSHDAEGFSL